MEYNIFFCLFFFKKSIKIIFKKIFGCSWFFVLWVESTNNKWTSVIHCLPSKGGGCSIILLTEESSLQYSSTLWTSWMVLYMCFMSWNMQTSHELPHSRRLFDLLSVWGGGKVPLWTGRKASADRLLCSHQPVAVIAIQKFLFFFKNKAWQKKKFLIRYCLMMINIKPFKRRSCDACVRVELCSLLLQKGKVCLELAQPEYSVETKQCRHEPC